MSNAYSQVYYTHTVLSKLLLSYANIAVNTLWTVANVLISEVRAQLYLILVGALDSVSIKIHS